MLALFELFADLELDLVGEDRVQQSRTGLKKITLFMLLEFIQDGRL